MDFASYVETHGCEYIEIEGGYAVFADQLDNNARTDLYRLNDHAVVGHVGGTYRLCRMTEVTYG